MADFEVIYLCTFASISTVRHDQLHSGQSYYLRSSCLRIAPPSSYQAGNFRLTISSIANIISSRMPLPQA
jgi:hypothetical protein